MDNAELTKAVDDIRKQYVASTKIGGNTIWCNNAVGILLMEIAALNEDLRWASGD